MLNTNMILRIGDKGHAMHGEALSAIEQLNARGHECVLVPQVIYEYWVVATRLPENNGLGMTVATANAAVSQWTAVFSLLLDERGVFGLWRKFHQLGQLPEPKSTYRFC